MMYSNIQGHSAGKNRLKQVIVFHNMAMISANSNEIPSHPFSMKNFEQGQ